MAKKPKKIWQCSDGSLFEKKDQAKAYDKILKIKKKAKKRAENECETCKGSGRNPYYSNHVGGSQPECPCCSGSGIKN